MSEISDLVVETITALVRQLEEHEALYRRFAECRRGELGRAMLAISGRALREQLRIIRVTLELEGDVRAGRVSPQEIALHLDARLAGAKW